RKICSNAPSSPRRTRRTSSRSWETIADASGSGVPDAGDRRIAQLARMSGYGASGDDGWVPRKFTAYLSTKYIPSQDKSIVDQLPAGDRAPRQPRAFQNIEAPIQGRTEPRGLVVQPVAQ